MSPTTRFDEQKTTHGERHEEQAAVMMYRQVFVAVLR